MVCTVEAVGVKGV